MFVLKERRESWMVPTRQDGRQIPGEGIWVSTYDVQGERRTFGSTKGGSYVESVDLFFIANKEGPRCSLRGLQRCQWVAHHTR
mmetsp:Transcript_17407/g.36126  ORF Transcript_17407/g.36126 Transcript_17407/m.36126 type:complete len:83 (-) Transcript_17407:240-488(-)